MNWAASVYGCDGTCTKFPFVPTLSEWGFAGWARSIWFARLGRDSPSRQEYRDAESDRDWDRVRGRRDSLASDHAEPVRRGVNPGGVCPADRRFADLSWNVRRHRLWSPAGVHADTVSATDLPPGPGPGTRPTPDRDGAGTPALATAAPATRASDTGADLSAVRGAFAGRLRHSDREPRHCTDGQCGGDTAAIIRTRTNYENGPDVHPVPDVSDLHFDQIQRLPQ